MVQNLAEADGETMTFGQRTVGGWHLYNVSFSYFYLRRNLQVLDLCKLLLGLLLWRGLVCQSTQVVIPTHSFLGVESIALLPNQIF